MNRKERRQAAKQPHQTQSFEELVGATMQKRVEAFVIQTVEMAASSVQQKLASMLLEELGTVQTRLTVLEDLAISKLGETKESLSERVLDMEDKALSLKKTEGPIEKGDTVRVTFNVKIQDKWTPDMNIVINRVGVPPRPNIPYQTNKEIEEALLGMRPQEIKEVEVPLKDKNTAIYKMTVSRISTPINKPQPAPVEAPSAPEAGPEATPQ